MNYSCKSVFKTSNDSIKDVLTKLFIQLINSIEKNKVSK